MPWDGLVLADNLGCTFIQDEGHCDEVVDVCTGKSVYWSDAAAINAECADIVLSIGKVEFIHCFGEAHELANFAFFLKDRIVILAMSLLALL